MPYCLEVFSSPVFRRSRRKDGDFDGFLAKPSERRSEVVKVAFDHAHAI